MKQTHTPLLFILIITALLITGCNSRPAASQPQALQPSSESGTEKSNQIIENKSPKIGISIYRYDDNFMKLYRLELKQYLEEAYHAEVILRNAGFSQEEQNHQVKQFIEEGCDGIIINPVEVLASGSIADTCSQAGIPLVFINRIPKESEQNRWKENQMQISCVTTDSRQAGSYQGEIILETPDRGDINGDGTISYIMIMGEEGSEDSRYRAEASINTLKEAGLKTENLFTGHGNWNQEKAKKLVQTALDSYGSKAEVIFCCNDAMANGALEALEEADRHTGRDIYLVGVDALEETVTGIKDGKITGTVFNDHMGQSHTAVDVLIKMLHNETVEIKYVVDYIKITTTNTFHNQESS